MIVPEDDVPTYAYVCTACDHRFEIQQAFTDSSLTECPRCSGQLRKLFNAVGIVFKGSGFYRTDSRSSGSAKTSATGASSPSPACSSDSCSSDSASCPKASTESSPSSTISNSGAPASAGTSAA
jgi:putative FmdB family regulatory protein